MPVLPSRGAGPTLRCMRASAVGASDRGRWRPTNEDAFRVRTELGLALVADGMGGHAAGEVASNVAADVVMEELARRPPERADATGPALRAAILAAHAAVIERARREPDKRGMGTTLTVLALDLSTPGFHIAHVGDSRAYRLRRGVLELLTRDHTWVQEQVDAGRLTAAEARRRPNANILTRALGIELDESEVDTVAGAVEPGDLFLLCTDGLTGPVEDEDLLAILDRDLPLEVLADQLIEAANLRGGPDNITVVLVRALE